MVFMLFKSVVEKILVNKMVWHGRLLCVKELPVAGFMLARLGLGNGMRKLWTDKRNINTSEEIV